MSEHPSSSCRRQKSTAGARGHVGCESRHHAGSFKATWSTTPGFSVDYKHWQALIIARTWTALRREALRNRKVSKVKRNNHQEQTIKLCMSRGPQAIKAHCCSLTSSMPRKACIAKSVVRVAGGVGSLSSPAVRQRASRLGRATANHLRRSR